MNPHEELQKKVADTLKKLRRHREESGRTKYRKDNNFYRCLVFQSTEQADAFIAAMEWTPFKDKKDPVFLNGVEVAKKIGVTLPATTPAPLARQAFERWRKLAAKIEDLK